MFNYLYTIKHLCMGWTPQGIDLVFSETYQYEEMAKGLSGQMRKPAILLRDHLSGPESVPVWIMASSLQLQSVAVLTDCCLSCLETVTSLDSQVQWRRKKHTCLLSVTIVGGEMIVWLPVFSSKCTVFVLGVVVLPWLFCLLWYVWGHCSSVG